ncbi:hypothetical protein EDB19DRAFT_1975617 [Suillus lakei]|nr:hypothetical protein EDB19DRAFT_1975617 [Suillus lakei]
MFASQLQHVQIKRPATFLDNMLHRLLGTAVQLSRKPASMSFSTGPSVPALSPYPNKCICVRPQEIIRCVISKAAISQQAALTYSFLPSSRNALLGSSSIFSSLKSGSKASTLDCTPDVRSVSMSESSYAAGGPPSTSLVFHTELLLNVGKGAEMAERLADLCYRTLEPLEPLSPRRTVHRRVPQIASFLPKKSVLLRSKRPAATLLSTQTQGHFLSQRVLLPHQASQLSSSTLHTAQNRTPAVSVSPASPPISTKDNSFLSVNTGDGTSSTGPASIEKFDLDKISGTKGEQACGQWIHVPDAQNSVSDVPVSHSKSVLLNPGDPTASLMPRQAKTNRRNILIVMIEPFSRSIKSLSKKAPTGDTPIKDNEKRIPPSAVTSPQKQTAVFPTPGKMPDGPTGDMAASTTKARSLVQ